MEVDIVIDKLTDCLVDRKTGNAIETEYRERIYPIEKKDYEEWKFNWSTTIQNGYTIYELFLKDDDVVQGRISLKIDGGVRMLTMEKTKYGKVIDIEEYANDSVLTEPSDGKVYDYRAIIKIVEQLGKPLTDKEAEKYRIK